MRRQGIRGCLCPTQAGCRVIPAFISRRHLYLLACGPLPGVLRADPLLGIPELRLDPWIVVISQRPVNLRHRFLKLALSGEGQRKIIASDHQ